MQYPASAYLNLVFLFFGAFLGSLACIVVGKVAKKRYFKFRLSLSFLLLAAAFAFVALMLLETGIDAQGIKKVFGALGARVVVLIVYAFIGAVCAAFLRTALPAVAVLYIVFTFCFGAALYKQMPLPQNITLTVSETFVRDESSGAEYKIKANGNEDEKLCNLVFATYNLNENIVLLLPNVWYMLVGANPNDVDFSAPFATRNSDSGIKKFYYNMCKKILGEAQLKFVAVPAQQVYPSLFNLEIKNNGANFNATLERIM